MNDVSAVAVLDTIATTLVRQDKFADKEGALRALAQTAVRSKIGHYQRRIRRLEEKYGTDFAAFTVALEGRADPKEEDDWQSWRSAVSMLDEWQTIHESLAHASIHH